MPLCCLRCCCCASAEACLRRWQRHRPHLAAGTPFASPFPPTLLLLFVCILSHCFSFLSLFCVSCTLPQILRLLCYFNMNLAHKVDLQSPFTSCSSPFLHCDLAIQPVWLPHPKTFNFFCLMAFLCIANCRSACFQLGISIIAPRETSERLQETF